MVRRLRRALPSAHHRTRSPARARAPSQADPFRMPPDSPRASVSRPGQADYRELLLDDSRSRSSGSYASAARTRHFQTVMSRTAPRIEHHPILRRMRSSSVSLIGAMSMPSINICRRRAGAAHPGTSERAFLAPDMPITARVSPFHVQPGGAGPSAAHPVCKLDR